MQHSRALGKYHRGVCGGGGGGVKWGNWKKRFEWNELAEIFRCLSIICFSLTRIIDSSVKRRIYFNTNQRVLLTIILRLIHSHVSGTISFSLLGHVWSRTQGPLLRSCSGPPSWRLFAAASPSCWCSGLRSLTDVWLSGQLSSMYLLLPRQRHVRSRPMSGLNYVTGRIKFAWWACFERDIAD